MANHFSHAALPYPIKNARYSLLVPYLDADGDPTDPTTPDTEISKDAGAFTDCAEEVSTISGSNGTGYITLTGAETDCVMAGIAAKVASGPKNTLATLYPRTLAIVGSGTLSAGSAGGGTLGTILAYDVTGCFIRTTGGTGGGGTGGASNQARKIITYTTSTGAFTVSPNWETTPDNTTTYDVLLPEGVTLGMLKALNPTTPGRTADVDANGGVEVGSFQAGAITNAAFAAGAIDAAAIAADAIGSSELAASAITEIQAGLSTLDAAGIRTAVGLAAANLDTQLGAIAGYIDTEVAAIKTVTDALPNGGALTSISGDITAIKAKTDNLPSSVKKNAALAAFPFVMVDSNGDPATGLTVTAERSIDGAALAGCANAVTEVANGIYKINLAAGDLNGDTIILRFTATGAKARLITLITKP